MVQAIGTWVYVISAALIVVAFVELLLPRSAATGLVRVVVGLCIIALILDAVLSLVSAGLRIDLDLDARNFPELAPVHQATYEGEALAAGTLAAIESVGAVGCTPSSTTAAGSRCQAGTESVSSGVRPISIQAVPLVKVGVERD